MMIFMAYLDVWLLHEQLRGSSRLWFKKSFHCRNFHGVGAGSLRRTRPKPVAFDCFIPGGDHREEDSPAARLSIEATQPRLDWTGVHAGSSRLCFSHLNTILFLLRLAELVPRNQRWVQATLLILPWQSSMSPTVHGFFSHPSLMLADR